MTQRQALIDRAVDAFNKHFTTPPSHVILAPGRINLIGEHTDYNDGHVLPIAIDRFTAAAVANRDDDQFNVHTVNLEDSFTFELHNLPEQRPTWASYVMGVVAEMAKAGHSFSGKDITIFTNIPIGAGVSSSAALEVVIATAIERLDGLNLEDGEVVSICRKADHNYVGINSGPMDQFASRACQADHCGLLDCRSLEMINYPLPDGIDYLAVYSGVPRELAASAYNERQAACQAAVQAMNSLGENFKALRDATLDDLLAAEDKLDEVFFKRARHVISEQQRVFDFIDAAGNADLAGMGRLLREGHESLGRDYDVSLPVLDEMIDWLYEQPEVVGARLTGAGFGGSLVCLVDKQVADVERLSAEFNATFADKTPDDPDMRRFTSEDGARYQPTISL
jgi:galactokinase